MAPEAFELFGCRGCGSAAVEVALEWIAAPYVYRDAGEGAVVLDALRSLNPLLQMPTLRFPDGTVMTESLAIVLALDEVAPDAQLLPSAGTRERRIALRWMTFVATNIYAAIGVGDYPDRWVESGAARAELDVGTRKRLYMYWEILEQALVPAPFLGGATMTMLDVYVATVSWWRPGRAWLARHCPRIAAACTRIDADPRVAPVWERNFKRATA